MNPNVMVQQTFHKSMFLRNRSYSTSSLPVPPVLLDPEPSSPTTEQNELETETQHLTSNNDQEQLDNNEWQRDRIPARRNKRKETSPIDGDSHKKLKNTPTFNIPIHNSFETLDNEQTEDTKKPEKEYVPKPEPIFVTGVLNIVALKEALNKIIDNSLYTMTTLRSGHIIKIMPKDIQTYKTIRENFIANNISHYTYQLKSERAYRVVMRGIHASEDVSRIAEELTELGHDVRQVVNVRHRATKEPLPMYYVDLEPKHNNKDIFKVKYLVDMTTTFEAPYKKKEILQCKRCQRFGHSKNQCYRPFRCVKCGDDHPTTTCLKKPDTEATCANCQEKHPASYKGCKTYKQYKDKILKTTPKPQPTQNLETKNDKEENMPPNGNNQGRSYADATKYKRPRPQPKEGNTNLNDMTELMETILEKLQQTMMSMMDKMMDKMLDRMVQLVNSLVKK